MRVDPFELKRLIANKPFTPSALINILGGEYTQDKGIYGLFVNDSPTA